MAESEEKRKSEKMALLMEDLASLEAYVHDLSTFSPLPICFISPVGIVLETNPAFEEIAGYPMEEIVGEPVEKFFAREKIEALAKETLKKGRVEAREMNFFPEGEEKVVTQVFTRVRKEAGKEPVGYFLGLFDLTEIKKREKELRKAQTALLNILEDTKQARKRAEEERKRTELIIKNLSDGLVVLDRSHALSFANPKAEKIFGIDSEQLKGESLKRVSEKKGIKPLTDLVEEEGIHKEFSRKELELGENLIVEVSNVIMRQEGELRGNLFVIHDVTREKVVERLKTEFVSISAHQLRTPLSAIKWSLKMLLDEDLGELTEEQKEFVKKTYQSNERMIALVNSLLNVTRIEEGRFVYKPEPVDIVKLTKGVIRSLRPAISKKGIEFSFETPEKGVPELELDREKIRIAVQNLIDNAVKYSLEGDQVMVSIERKEKKIVVRVEDTGVGIPQDQQGRVFTKFFRGDNVVRLETIGTGLGLFITRNIVEAHGGEIDFESEEGRGSEFWFTLPVKKEFEKFIEEEKT